MKGIGPCSSSFLGRECPFYPTFPIGVKFAPACCDGDGGCRCECIYQCATRAQIVTLLEANVLNYRYLGCTTGVGSERQGEEWRRAKCEGTEGGEDQRNMERECGRNGTRSDMSNQQQQLQQQLLM